MELTQGLAVALTKKAGFTVEVAVAEGFVNNSAIVNNFANELNAVIPTSKTAVAVINAASTIEEAVANIKPQTLKALSNKALSALKDKLEAKALINVGVVVDADGVTEFTGTLNVDGDGSHNTHTKTYGAMLLRSITEESYTNTGIAVLAERKSVSSATSTFLDDVDNAWTMVDEFNERFSTALAKGSYALGLGAKYYTITKEDSEVHKKALIAVMDQHELTGTFHAVLNEVANNIVAAQQKEEVVMENQPVEETVTITVTEYNMLTGLEAINAKSAELLELANKRIEDQEAFIIKAAAQLEKHEADMAKLMADIEAKNAEIEKLKSVPQVTIATPNTNTQEETKMTSFKIEIKDLKEVAARPTKEGKVVSKDAIEGLEVGNIVKAQVVTVDALKSVTDKIRTNAPIVTVKVANATHTGIDKVAEVAHKTTNVIAKATNTGVLKSANAVDAVLDFVAPAEKRVDIAAIKRMTSTVQIDDVVEIAGRKYTFKGNGNYEAL